MKTRLRFQLVVTFAILAIAAPASRAQQPLSPVITVTSLDQAALVTWDSLAEHNPPHPFTGYRLYRARLASGPFTLIREWRPTVLETPVRKFYDIGDDNADGRLTGTEGLFNELNYFYTLSAFADSVVDPYRPFMEGFSDTLVALPRAATIGYSASPITISDRSGFLGHVGDPQIVVTSPGNFRRLFDGHTIQIAVSTVSTGTEFAVPVTVSDSGAAYFSTTVLIPGCLIAGDTLEPGAREGVYEAPNVFSLNAFSVRIPYSFTQLAAPLSLDTVTIGSPGGANTPVFYQDTITNPFVGLHGSADMLGAATYEIEFLPGGIDTIDATAKLIFNYLNVRVIESTSPRTLVPGKLSSFNSNPKQNQWTVSPYRFNQLGNPNSGLLYLSKNRYYLPTPIDSATSWEFSNIFGIEDVRIVLDYAGKGRTIQRRWPLAPYQATKDFSASDKIIVHVTGGAEGPFPYNSIVTYAIGAATTVTVTSRELDEIRIVPNPYLIRNEAQLSPSDPRLRFDYLPDECEIRIYTVALDLVKVLHHTKGAVEYWDLTNQGGNRVGSQLFIARIEAPSGATIIKKFAVVTGQ